MILAKKNRAASTYRSIADDHLEGLAAALRLPVGIAARARDVFQRLATPWSETSARDVPSWSNDISDDGTPFEYSIAFGARGPELRMLVEAQSEPFSLASNWREGLAVHDRIVAADGASTTSFDLVRDLFEPRRQTRAAFALWHAAVIEPDGRTFYKAYLNPQIHGPGRAREIVREAFQRLGMPEAATFADARVRRPEELRFFSVDLVGGDDARAKVYVARSKSAREIEHLLAGTQSYVAGQATGLLRQLAGDDGPYPERPILVCFGFRRGTDRPNATLHVPVRCYSPNDETSLERIAPLLSGPEAARLRWATSAITKKPLDRTRGLISYASVRLDGESSRTTVYLAPQLFEGESMQESQEILKRVSPSHPTMRDIEDAVDRQRDAMLEHPFFVRLEGSVTTEQLRRLLPRFAFFTLAFQDLLRLSYERCSEPQIKEIARTFVVGDRGHEQWYLDDIERFGLSLSVPWLFSEDHRVTRDTVYSLAGLVLGVDDDRARMAVTLVLEALAGAFFARMSAVLERHGIAEKLVYFGGRHLAAENAHDAFSDDGQAELLTIEVSDAVIPEILTTIERAFTVMAKLADDLDSAMAAEEKGDIVAP